MTDLKPYILERKLLPKAWGGRRLLDALGIDLPPDEAIGESWELFDRPDGSSPLRGTDQTLRDLMLSDTSGVLGKRGLADAGWLLPVASEVPRCERRLGC